MNGLADDLARALDPVTLANKIGMRAEGWQAEVLRSRAARIILCCSRQSGKSTIAALLGTHTALYEAGSLVLLLSPTLRQSGELFRKCLLAYRALGRPVVAEAENRLSLELENGSRIVSLPGQAGTIRGYSGVRLLIIDEAAQVKDEDYFPVRPMLAVSGGRLILLSTPYGRRGFFWEAWRGKEPWQRYHVPATKSAHIRPEFLEEERRTVGEWWFKQEYMCEFLDAQTSAFAQEDIERAFSRKVEPWTGMI